MKKCFNVFSKNIHKYVSRNWKKIFNDQHERHHMHAEKSRALLQAQVVPRPAWLEQYKARLHDKSFAHWSHSTLDRATILSKWSRKTSTIVVTGSKFMQQRTMSTTKRNMNLCMNSCFAIVLHIVLCCINLLPVTPMMLVLASFLMLRRAHCCSIQSSMRSVVLRAHGPLPFKQSASFSR